MHRQLGMRHQNQFFFQKWSNLHERSGIGWIERKIKFQIFPIFIFRIMVIFRHFFLKIVNFRWIFTMTRNIKIAKLFFNLFQHIAHLSWKWDENWGGRGVGSACHYLGQSRVVGGVSCLVWREFSVYHKFHIVECPSMASVFKGVICPDSIYQLALFFTRPNNG